MRRIRAILSLTLTVLTACTAATTSAPPAMPSAALPPTTDPTPLPPADRENFAFQRERMVIETIERRGITDQDVLDAMRAVPRHTFVPEREQSHAYGDYPLPIGYGQTISQPYIVALMTELLELRSGDKVLEIGTGSGYQAAVLAEIPGIEIYTIEIVPELADSACERLESLGYTHVHCKQGDGYYGWPEHARFDKIIVTAAPDHVPQPLVDQLAAGGQMVIPVGPPGGYQTLWRFVKEPDGELRAFNMGGVAFVPFTGEGTRQGQSEGFVP